MILQAALSGKPTKTDTKDGKKGNVKKKKSDGEQPDTSLKGVDVRTLHEAYQTLMRKYCPDQKKKVGEND